MASGGLLLLGAILCLLQYTTCAIQYNPASVLSATSSSFSSAIKGGHITANVEYELYSLDGDRPGYVTEQWFTGHLADDSTRIRIYIDNETEPSLDFNLFMAHGVGCGMATDDKYLPWQTRRVARDAAGSVYNTYRIPFRMSIRVTATIATSGAFWYIVRGVRDAQLAVGQYLLPADTRLRLYKVNKETLQPLQFVTAAETTGTAGWLYQVTIHANSTDYTYLEGCFRAEIDGERQFLSSGTEDMFLSAYYFNKGIFHGDHAGLTCKNFPGQMSAYKFFEDDPVLFSKSLKLIWRCGETTGGENGCPNAFNGAPTKAHYSKDQNIEEKVVLGKTTGLGAHPTVVDLYTWVYEYTQG